MRGKYYMDNRFINLANYRMEQSTQCIKSAKVLLDTGDYKGAANRSYYSIFHAMRAVLALDQVDFSKHAGVSAYFRKEYIKTGTFKIEMSDIIKSAFDVRSDSDYDDYYVISKNDVVKQIENAEYFYQEIQRYLENRIERQESDLQQ
jgi:uncharacterized protein (UPF0332 family)